jgi:hypothetical protein
VGARSKLDECGLLASPARARWPRRAHPRWEEPTKGGPAAQRSDGADRQAGPARSVVGSVGRVPLMEIHKRAGAFPAPSVFRFRWTIASPGSDHSSGSASTNGVKLLGVFTHGLARCQPHFVLMTFGSVVIALESFLPSQGWTSRAPPHHCQVKS